MINNIHSTQRISRPPLNCDDAGSLPDTHNEILLPTLKVLPELYLATAVGCVCVHYVLIFYFGLHTLFPRGGLHTAVRLVATRSDCVGLNFLTSMFVKCLYGSCNLKIVSFMVLEMVRDSVLILY